MNSRQRVKCALNHKPCDKMPLDFGGTVVTSVDGKLHQKLLNEFGLEAPAEIIDYTMGTAGVSPELYRRFHTDVVRVGMNVIPPEISEGCFTNGFGIKFKHAAPHEYFDVYSNPLAGASDLKNMKLPDPDDERLYYGLHNRTKELYENTEYAIFADFGIPGFYETGQKLRGYENFACDLMLNEDLIADLFGRLLELQKKWFSNYLEQVGGYAVAVGYADDLGMQDRLQMSPEIYRAMIKPYHKEIFKFIHEKADIKIMLHSCGAIVPIIDDLIDAGVDILNPVQTRAAGMEPHALKKQFGDRVAFWGGMDEQYILPFGTKEEIDAEVKRLTEAMGKTGYVFGPGHNIQADTPIENIIEMYQSAEKYRGTWGGKAGDDS